MNLATVVDELAAALSAIEGLRVVPYPDSSVNPPQVTITVPESIDFDETYGRGSDRVTMMAVLQVNASVPRTAFISMIGYVAGSGDGSIKAAIEAGTYTQAAAVRVASVSFDTYTSGAVAYYAATFSIDITGSGT